MTKWKERKEICGFKLGREPTLNDVANCISLIPESIDTKGTRKVREYLDEKEIYPKLYYPEVYAEKPISEANLIIGSKDDIKHRIETIKDTIRWQLNDAPYTYMSTCSQDGKWEETKDDGMITRELVGTEKDHKGVCAVKDDDILKMCELSNKISKEDWDIGMMAEKIGDELFKEWKHTRAWDLSDEESLPLYEEVIEAKVGSVRRGAASFIRGDY